MLVLALFPNHGPSFDAWAIKPPLLATGGWRVGALRAGVDAWIAAATSTPEWVFVSIGPNDMINSTSQGSFETDLAYTIDAIHAAWASCHVGVTKTWMRNFDAKSDAMAGWVDNVLATRGAFATVSDDERVWMKGADNGATMTTDGIHYSTAGRVEKVNQMKAAMGY